MVPCGGTSPTREMVPVAACWLLQRSWTVLPRTMVLGVMTSVQVGVVRAARGTGRVWAWVCKGSTKTNIKLVRASSPLDTVVTKQIVSLHLVRLVDNTNKISYLEASSKEQAQTKKSYNMRRWQSGQLQLAVNQSP